MPDRLLYVVRHGQADGDEADSRLTPVGERQAGLLADRLADVPFEAVRHSPLARAARTAEIVAAKLLAGTPVEADPLLDDVIPYVPPADRLTRGQTQFFADVTPDQAAHGAEVTAAAVEAYTATAPEHRRELLITHNFTIGWLVRHALGAPPERWIGLNSYHTGITVLLVRPGRPVGLISYNDVGHLPEDLRGLDHPARARV